VLNSAERAPYVLMLEVLHGELDFDPNKRSNRDILKKIVSKELTKKGSSQSLATFGSPVLASSTPSKTIAGTSGKDRATALGGEDASTSQPSVPSIGALIPPSPTSQNYELPPEEEVDVIEQLYGSASLHDRTADLSESIVLPPAPKNKDLDRAAWARSGQSTPVHENPSIPPSSGAPQELSMEEYSERMRTAAVMLAQLNASTQPTATAIPPPTASGRSWLGVAASGSSINLSPAQVVTEATPKGPLHPSLGGALPANSPTQSSSRSTLSAAEASAIRERIMQEMLSLEEERMARMRASEKVGARMQLGSTRGERTGEDESIIRKELNKADPSAVVFSESWAAKKVHDEPLAIIWNPWLNLKLVCDRAGYDTNHHMAT
jgi:phosphatidylinositol 4-kinase B